MIGLVISFFIIGYFLIAFEQPLRINKSGTALLMGILIWVIYSLGESGLLFVPIFKQVFHLPPYLGILLVLGVVWLVADIIHRKKMQRSKRPFPRQMQFRGSICPEFFFF